MWVPVPVALCRHMGLPASVTVGTGYLVPCTSVLPSHKPTRPDQTHRRGVFSHRYSYGTTSRQFHVFHSLRILQTASQSPMKAAASFLAVLLLSSLLACASGVHTGGMHKGMHQMPKVKLRSLEPFRKSRQLIRCQSRAILK